MGERLLCKQEVIGSIPFSSTNKETGILEIASFAKVIGKQRSLPLIFDRTEKVRLFFNKTEEVKRTRRSIVVCWVRLYRPVPLEFGGTGIANTLDASEAVLSVMGSSD